jgi:hypothetical protein
MKKGYASFVGVLVFGLILAGCNSSGGGGGLGPVDMASLIGKWRIATMVQKGTMRMTMTQPVARDTTIILDTAMTYSDSSYYTQFNSDHTFSSNQPGGMLEKAGAAEAIKAIAAELTGTWSLSGSTLQTIFNSTPTKADTLNSEVGITGNKLTIISATHSVNTYNTMTYTTDITFTYTATKM